MGTAGEFVSPFQPWEIDPVADGRVSLPHASDLVPCEVFSTPHRRRSWFYDLWMHGPATMFQP